MTKRFDTIKKWVLVEMDITTILALNLLLNYLGGTYTCGKILKSSP